MIIIYPKSRKSLFTKIRSVFRTNRIRFLLPLDEQKDPEKQITGHFRLCAICRKPKIFHDFFRIKGSPICCICTDCVPKLLKNGGMITGTPKGWTFYLHFKDTKWTVRRRSYEDQPYPTYFFSSFDEALDSIRAQIDYLILHDQDYYGNISARLKQRIDILPYYYSIPDPVRHIDHELIEDLPEIHYRIWICHGDGEWRVKLGGIEKGWEAFPDHDQAIDHLRSLIYFRKYHGLIRDFRDLFRNPYENILG